MSFSSIIRERERRVIGLDILRAFAILIVVYAHGMNLLPRVYYESYFRFVPYIDGVSVFFVLSGFLIGGILLKILESTTFNKEDLLAFWIRRWFRTLPNYLLVLSFLLLFHSLSKGTIDLSLTKYFLFFQNFYSVQPGFFPESWSLCIEEWFYLLFPFTLFFFLKFMKDKRKALLTVVILFLIVPFLLRIAKYHLGIGLANYDGEFRKIVLFRLDSIMYGVLAAYLHRYHQVIWKKSRYLLLFAALFWLVIIKLDRFFWIELYKPFYFNIESVIVFMSLPYFSNLRSTRSKIFDSAIVFISIVSYSMYLLNLTPVQDYIIPFIQESLRFTGIDIIRTPFFSYGLYWFLTVYGSYLLFWYFERPMTKLRDKPTIILSPSQTSA